MIFKFLNRSRHSFQFAILCFALTSVSQILANEPKVSILDWETNKRKFMTREIPITELHLSSEKKLIFEHFEIHRGMSEEIISLEEAMKDKRIMTLVYHLSKAEQNFIGILDKLDQKDAKSLPRAIIRIDAPFAFSPNEYTDKNVKLRNTALTIPPSQFNQDSEIWFGQKWSFPGISLFASDRIIDTASCPDAIYHEYAHLITGKYMGENSIGRSLSEGLSDYFAASFLDYPSLYDARTCPEVKRQLFVRGFQLQNALGLYNPNIESNFKSDFHFIPSLLWKYRLFVGKEMADKTILKAVQKSDPSTRFYPEFVDNLSKSLFEEMIKTKGESFTKEYISFIERDLFIPHGLITQVSYENSVFSQTPNQTIHLPNIDDRSKSICKGPNEWEIHTEDFSTKDPSVRLKWKCDSVSIALIVDFSNNVPTQFLLDQPQTFLTGNLKFASISPNVPPTGYSHAEKTQYGKMFQFIKSKYLFYRTQEQDMRLYYKRDPILDRYQLSLEFAYPGIGNREFAIPLSGF